VRLRADLDTEARGTDWMTGVRSPTEEKDFSSSLCVQTSSEVHPVSYPMGTGVQRGRGVTLITHLIYCRGQE